MKSATRILLLTFAFTSIAALAQKEVEVKDTPASQTLIQLAKDHAADQKTMETRFQQARAALDQSNKSLTDQINSMRKALEDDLAKDKKYKDRIATITDLQKKFAENGTVANIAFQKDVSPIQQKVSMEAAQIQGLIPVVKKENSLPDAATFDEAKGKWTVPEAK